MSILITYEIGTGTTPTIDNIFDILYEKIIYAEKQQKKNTINKSHNLIKKQKRKRKQIKHKTACVYCRKKHAKCSEQKPCTTCKKQGLKCVI